MWPMFGVPFPTYPCASLTWPSPPQVAWAPPPAPHTHFLLKPAVLPARCGRRTSRCAFLSPSGFVPFFPSPSPPAFSLASRCPSFLTRKSTALARKRRAKSRSQHSQSPEVSGCVRTSCLLCNRELEAVALLFLTKIPTVLRNDGIITSSVCFVTHRSHFK